ncbi:FAD/NAD-P-binding domain-containing protein [Gautieria morchelliformis]|nr:FAD/NAD-P-binding domain-containing protein [Gautieria morchelliformis]
MDSSDTTAQGITAIVKRWLAVFADAAASGNVKAILPLFLKVGWLRDILVFTWTHRSLRGHDAIFDYLDNTLGPANISNVRLDEDHGIKPNHDPKLQMIEAALTFETPTAYGRGHIRLMRDRDGKWKAFTFFLTLDDLKGHEEKGPESGHYDGHTRTWNEVHEEEKARSERDPHVIIIGAGQNGLNVGARFRQMNIPTLLIEKEDVVGDVWRKRYPSLTLHTHNTHHTMLYNRFPTNAPKFTPRDKVAAMLEHYAYNQDLVIWNRTTILPTPSFNSITKRWTVNILRDGVKVTLNPYHIVLAIGTLGKPWIPPLPGRDDFRGTSLHATNFKGAPPFAGKKTIVVGASQTASDICQDLASRGAASVTMVQRSSTVVVTCEYTVQQLESIWPMHSDPLVGDFRSASMPLGLLKQIEIGRKESRIAHHKEMLDGLLKAGLNVNQGREGAGQALLVFERLGGISWLDLGTADLIIKGAIKIKQGTEPDYFTDNGLVFKDGSSLDADLVVFATGYEPIKNSIRDIFGEVLSAKVTPVWGLDEEGESRRAYTPSGHPGLWWAIGDFMTSRYYSKSLALQIKARELGLVKD